MPGGKSHAPLPGSRGLSSRTPKDLAASVRQRLLDRSRRGDRPFGELLQHFALERFLYRLSRSAQCERFILKGALLLQAWRASKFRPTKDIDLLGRTSNEEATVLVQVRDILGTKVEADGLIFDPDSLQAERIVEDADYEGIRIRFHGALGTAKVSMQLDIAFNDVVSPEPEMLTLPASLDLPAPRLLCYSKESSIAEKFQAMVKLGELNSRMKDFHDIWMLSRQFDFQGTQLVEAIRLTFERRNTPWPDEIEAFTTAFAQAKQNQWAAFRRRLDQEHLPLDFQEIIAHLGGFLQPIIDSLGAEDTTPDQWQAPGPWL